MKTYEAKGAARVWLAGTKADSGKRFCTLQIIARACNGLPSGGPRCGQPKLGIIFRGLGLRISDVERQGWHPDVDVRFQPKAWADSAYCEEHARIEMVAATSVARAAGRESVAIYDNLHGQTTVEHEKILLEKAKCVRHLLPGGVTAEIQLVDDGIGFAVKNQMGHALDDWMSEGNNLDMWTAEGTDFPMWRKRCLITHLAAKAWQKVCQTFDFVRAATRIGMLMTADGTGDSEIQPQGLPDYSFTDAHGGERAHGEFMDSSDDEELVVGAPVTVYHDSSDEEPVPGHLRTKDSSDSLSSDESSVDEPDDTAEYASACGAAPADPPEGFEYVLEPPPLETDADLLALVGTDVLHAWDNNKVRGWFHGKVSSRGVGQRDLIKTPTANFIVTYNKKTTKTKHLDGRVASTLSSNKYGSSEWWIVLKRKE